MISLDVNDDDLVRRAREYFAGKKHTSDAIAHSCDTSIQIEFPTVFAHGSRNRHVQNQIAKRLIGFHPHRIAHHFFAGQLSRFFILTFKQQSTYFW